MAGSRRAEGTLSADLRPRARRTQGRRDGAEPHLLAFLARGLRIDRLSVASLAFGQDPEVTMLRILALALAMLPAAALAQDAQKFDAKALETEFAPLPVFAPKKAVVDNEVIVTRDKSRETVQAAYVVRAELKKVLEFYSSKLSMVPQKVGDDDLGTVRYIYAPVAKKGDKTLVMVTISSTDYARLSQIALLRRATDREDLGAEDAVAP
jgi:hypothetical protein